MSISSFLYNSKHLLFKCSPSPVLKHFSSEVVWVGRGEGWRLVLLVCGGWWVSMFEDLGSQPQLEQKGGLSLHA